MKKIQISTLREQFERFQKKNSPCRNLEREGPHYIDPQTEKLWSTWVLLQDDFENDEK